MNTNVYCLIVHSAVHPDSWCMPGVSFTEETRADREPHHNRTTAGMMTVTIAVRQRRSTAWYAAAVNSKGGTRLKVLWLSVLICVSGCAWFGAKRPVADPTELVVTGAPPGAVIFVDGVNTGPAPSVRPQVIRVSPGAHEVEVHVGDPVVYREETYVSRGEQRVVTVLSGSHP
jgi:hypothetical protein